MAVKQVVGKVTVFFADARGVFIKMVPPIPDADSFGVLQLAHANYSTVFSLLMAAGVNKLPIQVGFGDPIDGQHVIIDDVTFTLPA